MITGFYGLDHPNPYGIKNRDGKYHGYRQRKAPIRVVVIHTPEVLEDYTGSDTSAESVARFFATTSRSASAHVCIDRDSTVQFLPPDHVAFHVRNYNTIGYGAEIGWKASQWGKRPDLDELILDRTAKFLAPRMKQWWVPASYVTKEKIDRGYGGMTSHAQLDPTRRTDPGRNFPWDDFLTAIRLEQMMDGLTAEEIRFLKAMIKGVKDVGSNEDFARSLIEFKRDHGPVELEVEVEVREDSP